VKAILGDRVDERGIQKLGHDKAGKIDGDTEADDV